MDKYAETKQILNDMASVKMAMNSHKGNIEDVNPSAIMDLLREEIEELQVAVESGDLMAVLQEAADTQNFVIALAYQQIEQYRSRK